MDQEKLQEILEKHKKWLNGEKGGERMIVRDSDLSHSDLLYSDLSHSDLSYSNLNNCDFQHSDLSNCDLRHSDLSNCDLRHSDLKGCNLDFSCLPLWCGSLSAHFDDRQLIQIAYHLVKAGLQSKNASDETKRELSKLIDFANKFHRVDECGRIERVTENDKV